MVLLVSELFKNAITPHPDETMIEHRKQKLNEATSYSSIKDAGSFPWNIQYSMPSFDVTLELSIQKTSIAAKNCKKRRLPKQKHFPVKSQFVPLYSQYIVVKFSLSVT